MWRGLDTVSVQATRLWTRCAMLETLRELPTLQVPSHDQVRPDPNHVIATERASNESPRRCMCVDKYYTVAWVALQCTQSKSLGAHSTALQHVFAAKESWYPARTNFCRSVRRGSGCSMAPSLAATRRRSLRTRATRRFSRQCRTGCFRRYLQLTTPTPSRD
jgi:hypothetical protein